MVQPTRFIHTLRRTIYYLPDNIFQAIYEAFGRSDEIIVTLGSIKSLHDVFSFRFTSNAKVKSVQLSDKGVLDLNVLEY